MQTGWYVDPWNMTLLCWKILNMPLKVTTFCAQFKFLCALVAKDVWACAHKTIQEHRCMHILFLIELAKKHLVPLYIHGVVFSTLVPCRVSLFHSSRNGGGWNSSNAAIVTSRSGVGGIAIRTKTRTAAFTRSPVAYARRASWHPGIWNSIWISTGMRTRRKRR